jgi:hypothetical protein
VEGSPAYEAFLACLGEKIALKGWTHYTGGLHTTGTVMPFAFDSCCVCAAESSRCGQLCVYGLPSASSYSMCHKAYDAVAACIGKMGTHSIFRQAAENDIMFHVATLLPFSPSDPQQVRKYR